MLFLLKQVKCDRREQYTVNNHQDNNLSLSVIQQSMPNWIKNLVCKPHFSHMQSHDEYRRKYRSSLDNQFLIMIDKWVNLNNVSFASVYEDWCMNFAIIVYTKLNKACTFSIIHFPIFFKECYDKCSIDLYWYWLILIFIKIMKMLYLNSVLYTATLVMKLIIIVSSILHMDQYSEAIRHSFSIDPCTKYFMIIVI